MKAKKVTTNPRMKSDLDRNVISVHTELPDHQRPCELLGTGRHEMPDTLAEL